MLVALEVVQCLQHRHVNPWCLLCVCVRLQLATAQANVERLQQQVTAGQPEMASLRARVEQLDKELQEAKV
jgi:capsule polysaccharide export protein KpsE/RkpR